MSRSHLLYAVVIVVAGFVAVARAQHPEQSPPENIDQVESEGETTPQTPAVPVDQSLYGAIQETKQQLSQKYGIDWAVEDTLIYQATSGGIDPNDAMVNTLSIFSTWKIIRDPDGDDFGEVGFLAETRANPLSGTFTEMTSSLGTLWSPNDSTSNNYTKISQLWWHEQFDDGIFGVVIGKIDPGAFINANRFAGSGNRQFFGQPFATNPARSFPDNGLGLVLQGKPTNWLYLTYEMSDSDANSTYSPFKTLDGRWMYAGEVGIKPTIPGLGEGNYRLMIYERDTAAADELGWSLSADQNLGEDYGLFLRYGGNEGTINSIRHIVSTGFSFLAPFNRRSDQAGIGVSYTIPSSSALRDEYSTEVYYRVQLTDGLEVSGSTQLIINPSASPQDVEAVFGLRARLLF